MGLSTILNAQNYLHQAIILNEGKFDYNTNSIIEPVTIGSYNPVSQTYSIVDTLEGMRFASDLIIDGNYYYVAADTKIFKIDLNSHQEVSSISFPGVRNLAIYQNKLVATRGEYLTTYDSYLHVYDISNLSLIQAIDTIQGPKWATQNIIIDGNNAYIAVNNAYEWGNEKGIIGKLDLSNLTYGNEIDLGVDGKNPDNMVKSGNSIYTINNKDWSGSSISKIELLNSTSSTVNLNSVSTGCGTSALRDDRIIYQISNETILNEFDFNLMNNVGPIAGINMNFYELAQEPINGRLYASTTDFASFGKVFIYDNQNNELSNFNVGIAPGTIGFDIRPLANEIDELNQSTYIYPNPTSDVLFVQNSYGAQIVILDMFGKVLIQTFSNEINLSNLTAGSYLVSVNGVTSKFIIR